MEAATGVADCGRRGRGTSCRPVERNGMRNSWRMGREVMYGERGHLRVLLATKGVDAGVDVVVSALLLLAVPGSS